MPSSGAVLIRLDGGRNPAITSWYGKYNGDPQPSFLGPRGYNPYVEGLNPSFFMVLGSKGMPYYLQGFGYMSGGFWISEPSTVFHVSCVVLLNSFFAFF